MGEPQAETARRGCGGPAHGASGFTVTVSRDRFEQGLSDTYLRIYRDARPLLQTRNNDIHTRISCQFAREILRVEGGDEGVVIPAILLHDVGWHAVGEERLQGAYGPKAGDTHLVRLHEREGASLARKLLEGRAYPGDLTREICRIIAEHDSGATCQTLEEAIVKDADKCYRAVVPAFKYFPAEVGTDMQGWYGWLLDGYRHWMFTARGRRLAETCLEESRQDLGLLRAEQSEPPDGI